MTVQHHAAAEQRSATYLCDRAYRDGAEQLCQSMTSRAVDQAVTEAFLEAVSPLGVALAARRVDQIEEPLAAQRQQHELQLEQARSAARLAQVRYEAVDPVNRLVAAELERRWNEQLERVGQLEQAFAQAAAEAQWQISAEERAAIDTLAQDASGVAGGDDHDPGAQAPVALRDRSRRRGWSHPPRLDHRADPLAVRDDPPAGGGAPQAGRWVTENAAASRGADRSHGADSQLRSDCECVTRGRLADGVWARSRASMWAMSADGMAGDGEEVVPGCLSSTMGKHPPPILETRQAVEQEVQYDAGLFAPSAMISFHTMIGSRDSSDRPEDR